jgi:polyisoprenoid-binding protein YceI
METILVFKVSELHLHSKFISQSWMHPSHYSHKVDYWLNQSDVLIKARHSIIAYIAGSLNKFNGHLDIHEDEIEDASVEFQLDVNNKGTIKHIDSFPFINFKSTSFQKISKNINFLKDISRLKHHKSSWTRCGINWYNHLRRKRKALFEITGHINRRDFDLTTNSYTNGWCRFRSRHQTD